MRLILFISFVFTFSNQIIADKVRWGCETTRCFSKEELELQLKILRLGIYQLSKLEEDSKQNYFFLNVTLLDSMIEKYLELRVLTIQTLRDR